MKCHISILIGLFCVHTLIWQYNACAAGNVGADPAEAVILIADATQGVLLSGKARLGKPAGKPDSIERAGMGGKTVAVVGQWSKNMDEESRVEFAPSLPKAGYYDVYVNWAAQVIPAKSANPLPITVKFDGGERTFRFVPSNEYQWVFLGTYPFKAGNTPKVSADAKGSRGGSSIFGVKFVPVGDPKKALGNRPKVLPILPGAQDEFDKMRVRAAELATTSANADLTNPMVADAVAQKEATNYLLWKNMQKQEGTVNLWNDLPLGAERMEKNDGGGWPLTRTFERMADLASAYVGSNEALGFADKMRGNPELLKDILSATNWLYDTRYNERSKNKLGADWIGMEIQNPKNIATMLLLLYPQISDDLMQKELKAMNAMSPGPDKFYGNAISTGFNRMFGVYAFALRSIAAKDKAALDQINGLIEEEYQTNSRSKPMVRKGKTDKPSLDGYYDDGSFIQHGNFPYIGIYGRGMLGNYAELQSLLAGSPWAITDPRAKIFYDWVYRGYAPLFFGGEIMYGSLGRSTGQSWHQNGAVSSEILDALVRMVPDAPPEDKAKMSSILKTWLVEKEKSAYPEFSRLDMKKISPESFGMLMEIKNDSSLPLTHPKEGTTVFYNTDYVVHHQPDFAMQLVMFSTRIKTHEDINEGTNRFGWYQGEGALFLYNRDNSRYNDNFWATVNPYRLPGITVDPRPRETPGSKNGELSTSPWAGGVELDGFGLASMGLIEPGVTLTAQKSWFFFGDQIVCLGSEIKSTDDRPIETIVENVKLYPKSDNAFVVSGQAQPTNLGWKADLKDVKWAHLAGTVPGTDTGWIFPGGATIKALREARTGNWTNSFKTDKDGADYTRNFLTLWFDHGASPTGATYAYTILPGRSTEQTKAYAEKPGVEIVENSAKAQTVSSKELGVTGANFWTDAAHKSGFISSSGKAAVLVQEKVGKLSIAVADPTQLETSVEITLDARVMKAIKTDVEIKVVSLSPLKLSVKLEKSDGKTFTAEFQK